METPEQSRSPHSLWVERLALTNVRSYAAVAVETGAEPQVIAGANGAGKTNLLEALSLLAPGFNSGKQPGTQTFGHLSPGKSKGQRGACHHRRNGYQTRTSEA